MEMRIRHPNSSQLRHRITSSRRRTAGAAAVNRWQRPVVHPLSTRCTPIATLIRLTLLNLNPRSEIRCRPGQRRLSTTKVATRPSQHQLLCHLSMNQPTTLAVGGGGPVPGKTGMFLPLRSHVSWASDARRWPHNFHRSRNGTMSKDRASSAVVIRNDSPKQPLCFPNPPPKRAKSKPKFARARGARGAWPPPRIQPCGMCLIEALRLVSRQSRPRGGCYWRGNSPGLNPKPVRGPSVTPNFTSAGRECISTIARDAKGLGTHSERPARPNDLNGEKPRDCSKDRMHMAFQARVPQSSTREWLM
ncbi:uncharacterized protein BJ171DRAFT_53814 [Polychytrium aggregatum]|uniref:uncharacterized protein n=1 Tax=Polychytrium aggregatum TaxID=110093 RepID=UPI0022FE3EC9|nr:uncharacterized protein BJ171DRAFT_53814 [Polychytrium aggregatum]KAI9205838.1 hypothetical protein BJ171DRAFT_53814 [Polychytrium aggregatum]